MVRSFVYIDIAPTIINCIFKKCNDREQKYLVSIFLQIWRN